MGATLDVSGFVSSLEKAAGELARPGAINRDAAAVIERLASNAAPRKSGRLAASGRVEGDDQAGTVVFTAGYGLFVNAGTKYMRARPFLTDAVDQATRPLTELYTDWVTDAINTVHD